MKVWLFNFKLAIVDVILDFKWREKKLHNAANQKRYNGTCFDYYLEWGLSQFHLK